MSRVAIVVVAAVMLIALGCAITGSSIKLLGNGDDACMNAQIRFTPEGLSPTCYEGSRISFSVENVGSSQLSGLMVVMHSDHRMSMSLRGALAPGESTRNILGFGKQELEGVRSLSIYPVAGSSVCYAKEAVKEIMPCR
jgi:hypothetical protein